MSYLTKNSSTEEMKEAIIEVSKGKKYICEDVINILSQRRLEAGSPLSLADRLSKREIEIVQQIKRIFLPGNSPPVRYRFKGGAGTSLQYSEEASPAKQRLAY